jgi:hypothetical protein
MSQAASLRQLLQLLHELAMLKIELLGSELVEARAHQSGSRLLWTLLAPLVSRLRMKWVRHLYQDTPRSL